jgi:hypothetical protein
MGTFWHFSGFCDFSNAPDVCKQLQNSTTVVLRQPSGSNLMRYEVTDAQLGTPAITLGYHVINRVTRQKDM